MNINRLHLIATYVFLSVILLYTDPQIISQTLDQGVFYYAIENVATGEVLVRGQTNRWGILANELILGPTTRYREWLLDPQTGLVGSIDFSTGSPGQAFRIPKIDLHPPETIDFDGDGLSDIAEFILKTEADNNDTDGDGILDGAEVLQGLDPLINPANDGFDRFARTGILASADTPGNAVDVCAVNNIAVVAHGETGISVFNIFNGMDPVIIAQINTPGFARDVDCSGTLIAVADSSAGLAIIDISDPPAASIIYQRRFSSAARAIVIAGSIVYIGLDSGEIVTVELTTGSILDRFDSGETVYDFSIEGDQLFVLSASKLIAYTLSEVFLELSGSISTEAFGVDAITGRKRLFVGGNVAYVTAFPGFATYNVSDPASITPLGTIQQQGVTSFKQIVANGSGDGIAVFGNTVFDTTSHDIARLNIANPADTSIQLGDGEVGFNTPGIAHAVSLFNGLAYVADGNAGLQVINYRDFDGLGVAPNIELIASFSLEPPEAEEGKFVRITANVSDDVQVRNVEFFIDGVPVIIDGNFPFEYFFVTPRQAEQATFEIAARAFDTGGNFTFSDTITITLTEDHTPPRVTQVVPTRPTAFGKTTLVAVIFNEPMNPQLFTPQTFFLLEAGVDGILSTSDDVSVQEGSIDWRDEALGAFIKFQDPLASGLYRASITTDITDIAGNEIAAEKSWFFRVFQITDDRDGDGVPDAVEESGSQLDPDNPDTDDDGISDGDEDFDGDTLTNAQEIILGTDIFTTDSDSDGIADHLEDRDGDGLTDAEELTTYGTDFQDHDTDKDGFMDGEEVQFGSSPLDRLVSPLHKVTRHVGFNISLQNIVAPAAQRGNFVGPTFSLQNVVSPASATGNFVGPTFSGFNGVAPTSVTGEVFGPTFSVENLGMPP